MLSELIIKNHYQFNLFNTLTKDEIKETKEFLDKNLPYDRQVFYDIINLNITQENVYEILWVCDILQYKYYDEVKEHIQLHILDNKIKITKKKLMKDVLYDDIYENKCLKSQKCKCNYEIIKSKINLKHLICFKYLESKNIKCQDLFNDICQTNNESFIKYFHELGYNGNKTYITVNDKQVNVIGYLYELGYKLDGIELNTVFTNGNLDIIKYMHKLGYISNYDGIIIDAARSGKFNILIYLHEFGYNGTKNETYSVTPKGYMQITKNINILGYIHTSKMINKLSYYDGLYIIKYLSELGYNVLT